MLEKLPKVSYFINSDILSQNTLYCIIYFIDIPFQHLNEKTHLTITFIIIVLKCNHSHQTRQNETNMI